MSNSSHNMMNHTTTTTTNTSSNATNHTNPSNSTSNSSNTGSSTKIKQIGDYLLGPTLGQGSFVCIPHTPPPSDQQIKEVNSLSTVFFIFVFFMKY